MADVKTVDEGTEFPEKRKLDPPNSVKTVLEDDKDKSDSSKKQRVEVPTEENGSVSLAVREDAAEIEELPKVNAAAEEEDEEDEEDYNAEEDEDGDEEAENVDRKGKGILKDDKGKGKVIEDSEDGDSDGHDDDDDDDSSGDSDSDFSDGLDDESDTEDDLLAEVDLGNILPSRTRQRQMQPGVRIASDSDKGNDA